MNTETLVQCRSPNGAISQKEASVCKRVVRKAATIAQCNGELNRVACDAGLAGPLRFAPSIADSIHTIDSTKAYDLDNAIF